MSLRRKNAPGELLKENRSLTGDCLPLLARLPSGSVDLTVTRQPHDDLRRYDAPTPLDLSKLGEALFRVTKDGGTCIVAIGDVSRHFAKPLSASRLALPWCDRAGWRLFETCLYHRHGVPGPWCRTRLRVDHGFILIFFKGGRPKTFRKERLLIPTKHAGEGVARRPYLSREFSEPGDLVLNPLMGSGTSVVMAAKFGRRFLGMEASARYVRIARQRMAREAKRGLQDAGGNP